MAFLKQILAPTDFSRNSAQAINYACDLAKQSNARLHLLHIARREIDQRDQVERLERIGAMVDARAELLLDTVKQVASGQPASVIIQYARDNEIDLVAMGTHGRSGLAHLTMGSVAETVLRDAPCPVLVLGPRDGETASLGRAVQVLVDATSEGIHESFEDGRTRLHRRLVDELRIPATTAIILFDELEDRQCLKYENGKWTTIEGAEIVDEPEPFAPDFSTDSPAIELIKRAKRLRATDIHIDPADNEKHLMRLRIDGQLKEYCKLHGDVATHLINQLKTLANVDIADPFRPKEANLRLPTALADLEIRLTSIPVAGGQAVALRLFDPEKIGLSLEALGFSESSLQSVRQIIQRNDGLVLVTGPTGSGKTTTVYSMLQSLGGEQQNIVSIEDPVEYGVPFVRQMNVDLKHDISMTSGLKTILRMDPDVIFVGEIRDLETAAIAVQAASSGKYIFSTMHTRDVASTITALRDRNTDNRSLSANLSGIINQRIVRRLCEHCKNAHATTPAESAKFEALGLQVPDQLFEPVGCTSCRGTGFHGRIGIFEVANVTKELAKAILEDQSADELTQLLRSSGTASLEWDALTKAASGLIGFNEAIGIRWLA